MECQNKILGYSKSLITDEIFIRLDYVCVFFYGYKNKFRLSVSMGLAEFLTLVFIPPCKWKILR